MFEAGLREVPVLYMRNKEYEEPLTEAVKCLVDTYEQGNTAEEMVMFIDRFRRNSFNDYMQKRRAVIEKTMPFLDGLCGKRIVEDMKNGIKEEHREQVRVVFFGAGLVCRHYIKELDIFQRKEFQVLGLADNNPNKWGTTYAGMQVMPPEKLKEIDFDILVIMVEQYHMPIKQKLVYELFLDEEKILRLDVFCEQYLYKDKE